MAGTSRVVRDERDPRGTHGVAPEVVRVELLGGLRVSVGSRTIGEREWRLKKAAALIKLLALEPGHRMHRERLMDLLWPELDTGAANNNFRQALHVARRTLDPAPTAVSCYLCLEGELLSLCPGERSWVDVEAFEEAAVTARLLREPAAHRAALELYAGDLLPEDRYEAWADDRREDLRRTYLLLLVGLAGLQVERGEPGPAIEALRRVVAEERTHEEAHAGLMRLYALAGRRDEALKWYERLREALSRELGTAPDADSQRLHKEILAGNLPPARPPREEKQRRLDRRHNLPAPRTSFVGREHELVEVRRLLAMTRLLTLAGAGGSGKTRLAVEVARGLIGVYPDGVWIVELAGLSEGALVAQAFAGALEVREQPGRSLASTLADVLRERSLLLVVDNCEHLVDDAARLVETLLDSCPRLRVLATSREVLGIAGELTWRVPSLSLPDPRRPPAAGEPHAYGSSRLFVERARSRRPGFTLTPENVRAVAEICSRLDGIPLAIELAAARMGVLSAPQIAERLGDSLGLLTGGSRTAPPRHRTLGGALDWSYELLTEPEQALFRRLSVFAGGWTLEAAEAVGAEPEAESSLRGRDVLGLMSRLVDRSLVVAWERDGEARYRLLEPLRQYGWQKLAESGEVEAVRRRHASFSFALVERAKPEINGSRREAWRTCLETEHGNLRTALRWSVETGDARTGMRLANAVFWFWFHRGYWREGRGWLEEASRLASASASPAARAEARSGVGMIAWVQGDHDEALSQLEESVARLRELGGGQRLVHPLHFLSMEVLGRGDTAAARSLAEESVKIARDGDGGFDLALALASLGLAVHTQKDYAAARPALEECAEISRGIGDYWLLSLPYRHLGYMELREGRHDRATALFREGLGVLRGVGEKWFIARAVETLAISAAVRDDPVRAARLFGAGETLRGAVGASVQEFYRADYDRGVAAARANLGEAAWQAALADGREMEPEAAINYALGEEEPPIPEEPSERPSVLTGREQEVAILVARGLTNRRISENLTISDRTVDAHLRKILKKLGLHSRTQVAAWAAQRGLI